MAGPGLWSIDRLFIEPVWKPCFHPQSPARPRDPTASLSPSFLSGSASIPQHLGLETLKGPQDFDKALSSVSCAGKLTIIYHRCIT